MSDWQSEYNSKIISIEEAIQQVKPNDRVFYSPGVSAPKDLINALSKRLPELGQITFISAVMLDRYDYITNPEYKPYFKHESMFIGPVERMLDSSNLISYPIHLSEFNYGMVHHWKPDIALCEVSAPDEYGYMCGGPHGGCTIDITKKVVPNIIVQVNNKCPYIYGDRNLIHVSEVNAIVEQDHEIAQLQDAPITDVERKIAGYIAERIEDGTTIQVGMGGLANAVMYLLEDKKDLGIHSEMLTNAMVALAKKGVINGSEKEIHRGKIVCAMTQGTTELYEFMNRNPQIYQAPITYTNDIDVIRQHDKFTSINNALMVDLTGQVGAESIGFTQYSSMGGQANFVRGVALCKRGQSFIALPSTYTQHGTLKSRIVLDFPPGQVVNTPRADVEYLVTEYGIAELKNKSIPDRVKAMINIAHPQFRDELLVDAKKAGFPL